MIVSKFGKMFHQLLDLILFTTIGILVNQALVGISSNLAVFLALFGLMQTSHFVTS